LLSLGVPKSSNSTKMIDLYPTYHRDSNEERFFNHLNTIFGHSFATFFTARSAMVAGLSAFGLSRMDEILVPPYLGHCILTAISRTSFPTMTPSKRTRAILVFHQFGFPQKMNEIESTARENDWIILNDCASTLFTKVRGEFLVHWGDFAVVSFSKIYPCGLGGGLWTRQENILPLLLERSQYDRELASETFDFYLKIQKGFYGEKTPIKIQGLYGYIPDIKSLATQAVNALPGTMELIQNDIERRKRIYKNAIELFGERVPQQSDDEDVVPFAIPVCGDEKSLFLLSETIMNRFNAVAPVLHFDYAQNMLNPDYRKALIIGCHGEWREDKVGQIFDFIGKEL